VAQVKVRAEGTSLRVQSLETAVGAFARAAAAVIRELGQGAPSPRDAPSLDARLALTERRFLLEAGLPGRPWFRHALQAPGLYLGYAAESLPGVAQALDSGDLESAQEQADLAADRIQAAAEYLTGGR